MAVALRFKFAENFKGSCHRDQGWRFRIHSRNEKGGLRNAQKERGEESCRFLAPSKFDQSISRLLDAAVATAAHAETQQANEEKCHATWLWNDEDGTMRDKEAGIPGEAGA